MTTFSVLFDQSNIQSATGMQGTFSRPSVCLDVCLDDQKFWSWSYELIVIPSRLISMLPHPAFLYFVTHCIPLYTHVYFIHILTRQRQMLRFHSTLLISSGTTLCLSAETLKYYKTALYRPVLISCVENSNLSTRLYRVAH